MNIVIFGANGPTGQLVTQQALAEGHTVTAATRRPETFPIHHPRLHVQRVDVLDTAAVDRAVAGQDAVLSTLGAPYSRKPIIVYSQGVEHIMQSMRRHGVRRLICVSSSATDPRVRFHDTQGGFLFERILKPFLILVVGRTLYADMWRMETEVMNSDLDWTIVRPSGLFATSEVTNYRLVEAFANGRYTSRTDLADCMLRLLSDTRYTRKAVAVVTSAEQPSLLEFLGREAFKRQPATA
ncbi:MAG TPA: SDR family oxidoreductase [Ktedonobacterales bacterium]